MDPIPWKPNPKARTAIIGWKFLSGFQTESFGIPKFENTEMCLDFRSGWELNGLFWANFQGPDGGLNYEDGVRRGGQRDDECSKDFLCGSFLLFHATLACSEDFRCLRHIFRCALVTYVIDVLVYIFGF